MEVLCGIRQIKCYAWEAVFAGKARSGIFFCFYGSACIFFFPTSLAALQVVASRACNICLLNAGAAGAER